MDILQSYLSTVYKAIAGRNGIAYAKLLALPLDQPTTSQALNQRQQVLRVAEKAKRTDHSRLCEIILTDNNSAAIVNFFILALIAFSEGDTIAGFILVFVVHINL